MGVDLGSYLTLGKEEEEGDMSVTELPVEIAVLSYSSYLSKPFASPKASWTERVLIGACTSAFTANRQPEGKPCRNSSSENRHGDIFLLDGSSGSKWFQTASL